MTAPELERQERLQVTASDGTTHRFYTHDELQAAIAAAMMGALDNFPADWRERAEEMRGVFKMQKAWSDGFNAARAALAASIPTDATATLGAALMGAYKEGWSDGAANYHHDRNETPDDGWLISDTYKSIPTDATAAAIRAMKGGA